MFKVLLFAASLACTTCIALGVIYLNRAHARPVLTPISDGVYLSPQLAPDDVAYVRRYVIGTIVDFQPDAEAADQLSHSRMETAAKAAGLDFFYIPIPHDTVPVEAVDALTNVLARRQTPLLLYCRTGRRAVRTFALSEASRSGGPDADALLALVRDAGFTADDLRETIATRIASRHPASEGKN